MNKLLTISIFLIIYSLSSCNLSERKNNLNAIENKKDTTIIEKKVVEWKTTAKDIDSWYNYTYNNIVLSKDFIPLDTDSSVIKKIDFLNKLKTGDLLAMKIVNNKTANPIYKLIKNESYDENIKSIIKQMADVEIAHYKMEGENVPDFNFKSIKGEIFTKSSTKGKIVVIKCWFIRCGACVKEFPELNKLVEENRNRKDIVFISLAIDAKKDLNTFLQKKEFKYSVIPEMEDFMENKLSVTAYPTHILIDKKGTIIKVVNTIDELLPFLSKELAVN